MTIGGRPWAAAFLTIAIATATVSTTHSARADTSPDSLAADSLFSEGRTLVEQSRFEEACERFQRSNKLEPSVGVLLNIGKTCYERVGKFASAYGTYRRAGDLARERNDPREADAREDAERIKPKLSYLTIALEKATPGVAITRNGAPVDPAAYDVAVPVDPGEWTVAATAPERAAWQTRVTLRPEERATVRVPELVPGADRGGRGRPQRTIAIGMEIGGGLLLATGLVFGGLTIAKWSSITDVCPGGRCANEADRRRLAPDVDSARTMGTVSTIGAGLGAAVLLTGIVLHLSAPHDQVSIEPTIGPGAAGLAATLRR
jgi:tetratricopeptide (TPR) repeat protein